MRTKTLLAVAALAVAGITSSFAQSSNVYSQNIVGYANIIIGGGNGTQFYANPFNHPTNNSATNLFNLNPLNDNGDNPNNLIDGLTVTTFTGSGFITSTYNSFDTPNNHGGNNAWIGWSDLNGNPVAAPTLNPGVGFSLGAPNGPYTNTYLGDVVPQPGQTNNFIVALGNSLIGSVLPVAGNQTGLTSPLPSPLNPLDDGGANADPAHLFDGITITRYIGGGFSTRVYNSYFTFNNYGAGYSNAPDASGQGGWAVDGTPSAPAARPNIPIGEGYYVGNSSSASNWFQYFTNAP